jgi:hypothetical protein
MHVVARRFALTSNSIRSRTNEHILPLKYSGSIKWISRDHEFRSSETKVEKSLIRFSYAVNQSQLSRWRLECIAQVHEQVLLLRLDRKNDSRQPQEISHPFLLWVWGKRTEAAGYPTDRDAMTSGVAAAGQSQAENWERHKKLRAQPLHARPQSSEKQKPSCRLLLACLSFVHTPHLCPVYSFTAY